MNGAQVLVRTLLEGGIDTVFTNPGTSEMHFVAALDAAPEMRCVLCLFEGVATGAADGYARMTGRPAGTLLHLGPGLANGLANLHNARKAGVPVVNIVGDHATYHMHADAPLTSDVVAVALPFSDWVAAANSSTSVGRHGRAAIEAALAQGGSVATLVLPANKAWEPTQFEATGAPILSGRKVVEDQLVRDTARLLRTGTSNVVLVGGTGLTDRGLRAAGKIAMATGARLLSPTSNARIQRGAGRVACPSIPYPLHEAIETLRGTERLILAGASRPVAYFAYPDKPAYPTPEGCEIHTLAKPEEDVTDALDRLADELGARTVPEVVARQTHTSVGYGPIGAEGFAQVIANVLPEQAIVVDEALTCGHRLLPLTERSAPHDWLQLTGGAIGIGMPLATGAAVACPDRKVLCLQADGSGMYTLQSLWTQAREQLNVTTIILANRRYATLERELVNVGVSNPGPSALNMLDIGRPNLDWVALANGMGVEASRVSTVEALGEHVLDGLSHKGPRLVEAVF